MTGTSKQEFKLIYSVAMGNGDDFIVLFRKYHPILSKMKRRYFVPGYDEDDLDQEAGIVLLRSAKYFKKTREVSFGTYYSKNLRNRVIDLIRLNNAEKRKPAEPLKSVEENADYYSATVMDPTAASPEHSAIVGESLQQLYLNCSVNEKQAMHFMLSSDGKLTLDDPKRRAIYSAFERCKWKYKNKIN